MRVYVWGTGRGLSNVIGKYLETDEFDAFVDNDISRKEYMGKEVIRPEDLAEREYDAVLVANSCREEIYAQCLALGIDLNRVIFLYKNIKSEDVNKNYDLAEKILGKDYTRILRNQYHMVRGTEVLDKPDLTAQIAAGRGIDDYVRLTCLELAVKEIRKRKLAGNTAEFGVFRGEFAQYINAAFPDKTLYLFDTFSGFEAEESREEMQRGNCTDVFVEAFKQTGLSTVYERMKYPEKIVIRQGFFPESLQGLEDTFCFVSLDVDFETSTYEGLRYFYPRLEKGGYLFIHDYNSGLRGVEKAVDRYEEDMGLSLCKMPLCDESGTLAVMK